jgi:hypothetical protein
MACSSANFSNPFSNIPEDGSGIVMPGPYLNGNNDGKEPTNDAIAIEAIIKEIFGMFESDSETAMNGSDLSKKRDLLVPYIKSGYLDKITDVFYDQIILFNTKITADGEQNVWNREGSIRVKINAFIRSLNTNDSPTYDGEQNAWNRDESIRVKTDAFIRSLNTNDSPTYKQVYGWLTKDFEGWKGVAKIAAWALIIFTGVIPGFLAILVGSFAIDAWKSHSTDNSAADKTTETENGR